MQALCQNLRKYAKVEKLHDIIIRTTKDVSDRLGVDERDTVVSQLPEKMFDSCRKAIQLCPKGTLKFM